jgi:fatty-acyl-CoA synthase
MLGIMQGHALNVASLIEFADRCHGDSEIVSRRVEGDLHRTNWNGVAGRARRFARWLDAIGTSHGERVATLAWNGYRHLEIYYGVSASGRVLHTLNPRLPLAQLVWIINDAQDEVVCFDLTFLPLVQAIQSRCPGVRHWVALCDQDRVTDGMTAHGIACYESLIDGFSDAVYSWPSLDENAASSLCYTSGTTGNPKGVLYSHRSTVLHAYAVALPDSMNLSARNAVLPVVPMFHVNAWGLPYSAALTGAKLVFPGPALDGKSVYELIESESVDLAAGVPTVWQMLLNHVQSNKLRFSTLKRTIVGGSACPAAMIDAFADDYGVELSHAWGMTELSPLGTVNTLKRKHLALPKEQQRALRLKQGRPVFGVDLRIVDNDGLDLPQDGASSGELMVRGPWVVDRYFKQDHENLDDGWFRTGDIATLDADGFLQITDRAKDVIKSGGEWISSIDIENVAMAHPGVAMAACIAVPHPKWDERPLLVVVPKSNVLLSAADMLAFFDGRVAKWQVPDDVIFVDALPIGATGKVVKHQLREQFKGHHDRLHTAPA